MNAFIANFANTAELEVEQDVKPKVAANRAIKRAAF